MADFNGTRDSSVAISEDNAGRKVLILDTITQVDSLVGNMESAEGVFDLGGTDSTSNPTNFGGNIKSSGFYTFDNTLSLDAIYDTNLGAVIDVTDQFVQLELKGENVYEIFSAGSPFNFNEFKEKKGSTTQTVLNHVDVILHHKDENILNLFVRRSFAEHLCSWIEDCASRL